MNALTPSATTVNLFSLPNDVRVKASFMFTRASDPVATAGLDARPVGFT